ncbi:diacylglycerol kinase eta-like isoform X2 [Rhopilema esculentum]|uniref:diacylglycerol kinase eta-like isoform X2 n=1 Tax=Rhopilema esculentum TaxID=499914 RepID=UPI0031DC9E82
MLMASYNFDVSVKNYDDGPERNADVLTVGFRKRRYSTAGTLESIEECIKEGFLLKQHGSFQRWKPRYFRLYPKQLFYAKSPSSAIFHEIDVSEISLAETSVNNVNNSFKVIASHCSLVLCAEKRKEMEEWINAFKVAASSIARTHSELTDRLSGEHHWYSSTHSRPTFCNVCGELLAGISGKGLSCEVCRFKAHKQCASKAPKNCKWTTLDSIPPDLRLAGSNEDPFSMPHQWFEGNLPPNSRCCVCDNQCGSKRRIQDWTCLWCDLVIHNGCKSKFPKKCSLGLNNLSTVPPTALQRAEHLGPGVWEALTPARGSPLLVFVNSKSGDNQGIRFMRTFKQLLNPAQVFDLSVAGPTLGLNMSKNFEHFRILVCGGDGSVGWVLTEVDKQELTNKCQIAVLPLGTGNDLARVLGWGSTCYDVGVVPLVLKQLERARPEMLDRWSICVKRFPSDRHEADGSITGYEDSIGMHLTRMLSSNQYDVVLQSARFVFETVKDFVAQVGNASASSNPDEASDPESMSQKCMKLQNKMSLLLKTLQVESEAGKKTQSFSHRRSSLEHLQEEAVQYDRKLSESFKSHSDSEIGVEEASIEITPKRKRKPKIDIPKEHLWSRANSLKKAVREIITHTEKAVDEQNAQTTKQVEEAVACLSLDKSSESMSSYSRTSSSMTDIDDKDSGNEKDISISQGRIERDLNLHGELITIDESLVNVERRKSASQGSIGLHTDQAKNTAMISSPPERMRPTRYMNPTYRFLKPDTVMKKHQDSNTVVFPGTVIAKSFVKEQLTHRFISRVLLANANALAAAAMPEVEKEEDLSTFEEKCVMNNYFGIGIDAKICLDFHNKREEHPEKCRSRKKNMIWYGVLGGKEMVNSTYKNLDKNVHIECDGHAINLPSLQGIVILNIPSYMGGANFWGTKKDVNGFYPPSFDDRMLEVVAVLRASQMGMSKVFGGMQHCRIAQCHTVKITITDEAVPVQVDGEAWFQEPGIIHIVHKNRVAMLIRDREFEETLRSWNELKQGKDDRINEPLSSEEEELLKPLSNSLLSLVRGIKAVSMICSEVHQELYQSAVSMSNIIEQIDVARSESLNRGHVCDFVNQAKAFISEVNEQLWTLKPELSSEMEGKIVSALSHADTELSKFVDQQSLLSVRVEEEQKMQRATQSTMKEKFNLFSKQTKDRSDILNQKRVTEWGISEVGIWLDSVGCGEYREIFNQHDIRGPELIALEKVDLHELGITKIGHVKRILEKIKQLEKSMKSSKSSKWSRKAK